jgi:hypoxanthine phosphoribosyltransferase
MECLLLNMDQISVNGKIFELFIDQPTLQRRVEALAEQINEDYAGKDPLLIPVLNGAFLFAADLIRNLKVDPEIQFFRVSTYGDNMSSNRQADLILGKDIDVKGRHVLLIEDIVDTGNTCDFLMDYVRKQEPASIRLACLLYKPDSHRGVNRPDYFCFRIPPEFVVGYGLDFAQKGREHNAIYRLKPEA